MGAMECNKCSFKGNSFCSKHNQSFRTTPPVCTGYFLTANLRVPEGIRYPGPIQSLWGLAVWFLEMPLGVCPRLPSQFA